MINVQNDNMDNRHERIAELIEAYSCSSGFRVLIQEKIGQSRDILTHLSEATRYTEQTVALVTTQILDGLQYLHWRGYCHLDLQPSNVIVTSPRSAQVYNKVAHKVFFFILHMLIK